MAEEIEMICRAISLLSSAASAQGVDEASRKALNVNIRTLSVAIEEACQGAEAEEEEDDE